MYFTYILLSLKDKKLYTGFTSDLKNRFLKHENGQVVATKHRLPLEIVYYEGCLNRKDAMRREIYLKSAWERDILKIGFQDILKGPSEILLDLTGPHEML